MRDLSYLRQVRTLLVDATRQVKVGVARGDSLAAIRRSVRLEEHRTAITGDEKWLNVWFKSFVGAIVGQAHTQEVERVRAGPPG